MKKNKKTILIVIVILLLSTLLTASIIFGRNIAKKFNEKLNNENEVKEEKKDNENKDEEEPFDFKLKVYSDEMQPRGKHYSIVESSSDSKLELEIEVESEDAQIYDIATTARNERGKLTYVLYKDKTLKLLNVENNTTEEIDLDYDNYYLQVSYDGTKIHGIIYNNNNTSEPKYYYGKDCINWGYYNLSTKQKMYENEYDFLRAQRGDFIEGAKFIIEEGFPYDSEEPYVNCDFDSHVLNIYKKEIVLKTVSTFWNGPWFTTEKYNNKYYFLKNDAMDTGPSSWASIYSNSGRLIVEDKGNTGWSIDKNGKLYIVDNNKVKKYNTDGKLISSSKSFSKIVCISNKYIIYHENNELFITDYENTFTKKLIDYTEDELNGLHDEEYIENIYGEKEGVYLDFIVNGGETFKTVYFNPTTHEVEILEESY